MSMKKVLILLFCIYLISGCSTNKSSLVKINDRSTRIETIGLSLLPPPGEGWYYQKISPARRIFGKSGNNKLQSLVILIVTHKLSDIDPETEAKFLELISHERQRNAKDESRFKMLLNEEKVSKEKNELCVRYHQILEDHGSKYVTKEFPYFVVEDIGLICRHPDNKNTGVTIAVSQRGRPGETFEDFEKVANEFISNATFISLPKEPTP